MGGRDWRQPWRHASTAVGNRLPKSSPPCRGDCLGERTAGLGVGDQHGFFRIHQLGRLGHEIDAAHDDDIGFDPGGLVEDGFEENAEVLNSEAETTQEPPSRDHICEFVCRHYLITEEDIQECIRVDCGRFNATNDGKKNSSEVLISEAETAPGSGNSCHFQCVLNGRSYDEVQVCIKARCRGVKTENDGKKNFDATEVLISEPENEPAGNSKTENNDVSEVLITETFVPIDSCIFNCIANGQTHREIENCINWRCNAGKSDETGEAKANIASEVRISENASTAQASPECIWDCLRALGVHAVSEDDFEQCSLECGSRETIDESEKEFNLRGSIKSD